MLRLKKMHIIFIKILLLLIIFIKKNYNIKYYSIFMKKQSWVLGALVNGSHQSLQHLDLVSELLQDLY